MAQLPAVDGINAKISGFGGWIDTPRRDFFTTPAGAVFALPTPNRSNGLFGTQGSISVPLGQRFGLQIDGLAASGRSAFVGGGGAHLFWRDPAQGLFGLYGSATRNNAFGGFNSYRLGGEGELYLNRFTISGVAGWEQTQGGSRFIGAVPGFNIFENGGRTNRFFDSVDLIYYPTDHWKVSIGHRYKGGVHYAAAGTEYMFRLGGGTGVAAFVEGRLGENRTNAVFAGLTFYFGQKAKSLIRRHREDDPPNRLIDDMFAGNGSDRRRLGVPTAPPPPPAVPCVPPTCGPSPCGD